jgi:hypothetical protein
MYLFKITNDIFFGSFRGWDSWNHFGCKINEQLIMRTADAIVTSGLAAAGYEYSLFIIHLYFFLH